MAKLRITWVKSSIGYAQDQKVTVRTLGLHRLNETVEQDDNPAIRGMVHKVRHLVSVEEVEEADEVESDEAQPETAESVAEDAPKAAEPVAAEAESE